MAIPALLVAGARALGPAAKNFAQQTIVNNVAGRVANFGAGMSDAQKETDLSGGGGLLTTHHTALPGTDTDAGKSYVGF
jgi:hypothetical protein